MLDEKMNNLMYADQGIRRVSVPRQIENNTSHPWYCGDAERDEPLITPEIHDHYIRKGTPYQMREIAILRL